MPLPFPLTLPLDPTRRSHYGRHRRRPPDRPDPALYGLGKLDLASTESVNKHLEGCADCQRRVAAMSSDSFLGRLRDAQGQPSSTGPVVSSLDGLSMLDAGPSPTAPPPADSLPPGLADHPDYEVIRELGQGGMGTVYLAKNRLMGRHEVLKVVSKHMMQSARARSTAFWSRSATRPGCTTPIS